jgi:hypothetical protein
MPQQKLTWKKGRGKLGMMDPLIGSWAAEADSPMGKLKCTRIFERTLAGNYIDLKATWDFGKSSYVEHAIIGVKDGVVSFWSFTSDGKNSHGQLVDGTDVHAEAICFEAQMPAGIARMVYWPSEDGTFNWAVESKTKKGWNRFTSHHYKPVSS